MQADNDLAPEVPQGQKCKWWRIRWTINHTENEMEARVVWGYRVMQNSTEMTPGINYDKVSSSGTKSQICLVATSCSRICQDLWNQKLRAQHGIMH